MTIDEENPDPLLKVPQSLKDEYAAQFTSMNTPEARVATKSAFDADPEVFRRPLMPEDTEAKAEGDT